MFKNLFKKKEKKVKKQNHYHAWYEDELFFKGIKLIGEKNLSEQSLVILGSLMGVVLFKGNMKEFDEFLTKRASEFTNDK